MAYKNNGGATAGAKAGAMTGMSGSGATAGAIAGAKAGMNYDTIPFKNADIDMLRLKEQAKNQGMKMKRTLTKKPMSFMDRVRARRG